MEPSQPLYLTKSLSSLCFSWSGSDGEHLSRTDHWWAYPASQYSPEREGFPRNAGVQKGGWAEACEEPDSRQVFSMWIRFLPTRPVLERLVTGFETDLIVFKIIFLTGNCCQAWWLGLVSRTPIVKDCYHSGASRPRSQHKGALFAPQWERAGNKRQMGDRGQGRRGRNRGDREGIFVPKG